MKLISKHIDERDGSGSVTLVAEESEDMWHVYNLVCSGDELKATTIRRVVSESSTGSTDKTSVRLTLTIAVETVDFDVQACMLRVNGRNIVENKYVKMGGYHTIDLEPNRPFTITKQEWDSISLSRITTACDVTKTADVAAVILEEGLANICLITNHMTIVRSKIEMNVPRKRKGSSGHEKGLARFWAAVYEGVIKNVDFDVVKVMVIASPGFYREQFYNYLKQEATKTANKPLLQFIPSILLIHSSSGQKHALSEALNSPSIQAKLSDTKFSEEVKSLQRFYSVLGADETRAFYGFRHVEMAARKGGIEVCLLTDALFRSQDISERKKYIALVTLIESQGGKCLIFSSLHTSGEQLGLLTGIACICHFPLPELEEEAEREEEREKREREGLPPMSEDF